MLALWGRRHYRKIVMMCIHEHAVYRVIYFPARLWHLIERDQSSGLLLGVSAENEVGMSYEWSLFYPGDQGDVFLGNISFSSQEIHKKQIYFVKVHLQGK